MQALKALVIGMAMLIVAGIGLLGYGLYSKARDLGPEGTAAGPVAPGAAFGTVELALPPGASARAMAAAGGRVVLLVEDAGGGQRLLMIDPESGAHAGTVVLAPGR